MPETWTQNYNPLGRLWLSALVAAIPVVVLLGLLAWAHMRAHMAALIALLCAGGLAVFVCGMPFKLASASAGFGAAFGLFPIGWIVLNAMFIYELSVRTGKFEIIKHSIGSIATDKRVQGILVGFCFGAFVEGAAGFGTPVAISTAMLMGLGWKPLEAATVSLIGNTAPVAFGALGTPLITLAEITKLPLEQLSAIVGRTLPLFSLIVPFWLVWTISGFKGMLEVWHVCLCAGLSFAVSQFAVSNFHGPWLVDIISSLFSIGCVVLLLTISRRRARAGQPDLGTPPAYRRSETLLAWLPWIMLSVFVFIWGLKPVKTFFNGGPKDAPNFLSGISVFSVSVPYLDGNVLRNVPVVAHPEPEKAVLAIGWLSATGTALLLAGIFSGFALGLRAKAIAVIFGATFMRLRISLLTIALMLALGYTTRFSGLDATMGLALASTGSLFPFFSPILGWLGVALTGSDTASNVLFGNLQQVTAQQLNLSPALMAAANSSGGVMGKMIDAQSIVVAGVATGQDGKEGLILRAVFWHSLALAVLMGFWVFFQAMFPAWFIPG